MIVQGLLDFVSQWLSGLIKLAPPLPPEWSTALAGVINGGNQLGPVITKFGVIVPFDVIGNVLQWFVALLAFWGSMAALRALLWILGR